ncbi:UNVERIFIED_CONTAM: hypothetical protein FKN15_052068 [Acipenser sinensis]
MDPSSELASETEVPAPSSSTRVLMEQASNFLEGSVQTAQVCIQTSTDLNPPASLASLEGAEAIGLAQFPPVDCIMEALQWCPTVTTVTRTVPIPTAPWGDLRHRLQASAAANTRGS